MPYIEEALTYSIIGAGYEVYREQGCGRFRLVASNEYKLRSM